MQCCADCSRIAFAVMSCVTVMWHQCYLTFIFSHLADTFIQSDLQLGAILSRTKFQAGMHCLKSAADQSAKCCIKSKTPLNRRKGQTVSAHWRSSWAL